MKITVCELRNSPSGLTQDWEALVEHVRSEGSDLVLLPEMAFHPWLASSGQVDPAAWQVAVTAHDRWLARLGELGAPVVVGTRPVIEGGVRYNEGFVWEASSGYQPAHRKYYLPDEPGYWEASWYKRGTKQFDTVQTSQGQLGFLICTELWFNAHAREYMKQGVDLLVCPRATPAATVEKWIFGGRTAAVVSGAYCLSSNFSGEVGQDLPFGGAGWVIEPEGGNVLGVTSKEEPFLTVEIDLSVAAQAKGTYPRYVPD